MPKFKGKIQSLLEEMENNVKMINKLIPEGSKLQDDIEEEKKQNEEKTQNEENDEMLKIINEAMKEAESKGIKSKHEIQLLVLK